MIDETGHMLNLECILAIDSYFGIGLNNALPWSSCKSDLQHFQDNTADKYCIVGRKTFESLPLSLQNGTSNNLRNRHFLVMSRNFDFDDYGQHVTGLSGMDEFLEFYEGHQDRSYIVVGGRSIFDMFIPCIQKVLLSKINTSSNPNIFLSESFRSFLKHLYKVGEVSYNCFTLEILERPLAKKDLNFHCGDFSERKVHLGEGAGCS